MLPLLANSELTRTLPNSAKLLMLVWSSRDSTYHHQRVCQDTALRFLLRSVS